MTFRPRGPRPVTAPVRFIVKRIPSSLCRAGLRAIWAPPGGQILVPKGGAASFVPPLVVEFP